MPVILFYLVLRLFLNIKIGKIETRVFGHLLPQTDIFICENYKKLYKNLIVIWFTDKIICNKYILKKFKKHLIILPRHILEPINLFFSGHPRVPIGQIPEENHVSSTSGS